MQGNGRNLELETLERLRVVNEVSWRRKREFDSALDFLVACCVCEQRLTKAYGIAANRIADVIDHPPETVRRSVHRLVARGVLYQSSLGLAVTEEGRRKIDRVLSGMDALADVLLARAA